MVEESEVLDVAAAEERHAALVKALDALPQAAPAVARSLAVIDAVSVQDTQREVRRILSVCTSDVGDTGNLTEKIDHIVLHVSDVAVTLIEASRRRL